MLDGCDVERLNQLSLALKMEAESKPRKAEGQAWGKKARFA